MSASATADSGTTPAAANTTIAFCVRSGSRDKRRPNDARPRDPTGRNSGNGATPANWRAESSPANSTTANGFPDVRTVNSTATPEATSDPLRPPTSSATSPGDKPPSWRSVHGPDNSLDSPDRLVNTAATRSASSRFRTKPRIAAESLSNQWASSTMTNTGRSVASNVTNRNAAPDNA